MIAAFAMVVASFAPGCLLAPLDSPIVDPFRPPPCEYCAGNRGLEYRPSVGSAVRAAAAGTVVFSGLVAGVRYVVVRHADGLRASYGYLAATALRRDDRVVAGQTVGTTTSRFFFGLRDGAYYVDPQPRLGVVAGVPRLVPVDGSPPRPSSRTRVRCGTLRSSQSG
jgi:murein DD-endopeptidase MepM/ murein hydrolase activator NlpD